MTDLMQRMRDGVPDAPDLAGLAGRAERDARRRRTARRGAVLGSAVALTVAALVVPQVLRGGPERSAPPPAIEPEVVPAGATCVSDDQIDHPDFTQGTAVWVRFCVPLDRGRPAALVSAVTLQTPEAMVATWRANTLRGIVDCADFQDSTAYSIQIGFADGTVAALDGLSPVGCPATVKDAPLFLRGDPYVDLMTALALAVRGPSTPPRPDLVCPNTSDLPIGSGDVEALSTFYVSSALVCDYDRNTGDPVSRRTVTDAEPLRLAILSNRRAESPRGLGCAFQLYRYDRVVVMRSRNEDVVVRFASLGCGYSVSVGDPGRDAVTIGEAGGALVALLSPSDD